jgi:hypothetical protein
MSSFAPQVRIVDGRIVLNEESLYVRHEPDPSMMHVIHDAGQHVTSATYLARESSDKWNHEETEKFYKVRTIAVYSKSRSMSSPLRGLPPSSVFRCESIRGLITRFLGFSRHLIIGEQIFR